MSHSLNNLNPNIKVNTVYPDNFDQSEQFIKRSDEQDQDTSNLRRKGLYLALSSTIVHLALSISNISYRLFNIFTFYYFRKNHENDYPFKAKLFDTGKDFAIILAQPFAVIALEIAAITGIIFPKHGLKLYFDIENQIYDRPVLSQIVNYHPIEMVDDKLINCHGDFSPTYQTIHGSDDKKFTPVSPKTTSFLPIPQNDEHTINLWFAEKLQKIIDQENLATIFNANRLATNCTHLFIDHVIEDFPGENFEEWFAQEFNIVLEKSTLPSRFFDTEQIYSGIANKLLDYLFETPDISKIQKFYSEHQIQPKFLEALDNTLKNLNFDELTEFKNKYLLILTVIDTFSISPIPEELPIIQGKIVDEYTNSFGALFEKIDQSIFDQNLKDKIEILQEIIQTIKSPEYVEGILEKLIIHKLEPRQVPILINYFSHTEAIKQAIIAYNFVFNDDPSIAEFSTKVNQALDALPEEEENNFYLQFFLIHVRNNIETMGLNMADKFKNFSWDWTKKIHCNRRDEIQAAIERINKRFQLDIECVIESKTDYDKLVSPLAVIFTQLDTQDIREWCEIKQNSANLIGFENWLIEDQLYLSVQEIMNPQNIDELYQIYFTQTNLTL